MTTGKQKIVQGCTLRSITRMICLSLTRFHISFYSSFGALLLRIHEVRVEGSTEKHALVRVSLDERLGSKHSRRSLPCLSLRRWSQGRRREEKATGCSLMLNCVILKSIKFIPCGLGIAETWRRSRTNRTIWGRNKLSTKHIQKIFFIITKAVQTKA